MTSVLPTALAPHSFAIDVERGGDAFAREKLLDAAMGPGRFRKSSQKLRNGRAPALADLPALPYTRMVLDESLRLYPPAWAIGRQAVGPDTVLGHALPAGANVALSPYVTHRLPQHWPDPERFDPERFRPEAVAARHRFAYFPFGGGPRLCIGNNFALLEAQLALATIAGRYRLDLVPGHPVESQPLITLRARHGLVMRVARRE